MTNTSDNDESGVEPGQRYWNPDKDEFLLVIETEAGFAYIQDEDGSAHQHPIDSPRPEGFVADDSYELSTDGPRLADACEEDSHTFGLSPDDTGQQVNQAICGRCGLSVFSLMDFGGQNVNRSIPWRCPKCEGVFKGTAPFSFEGNSRVCKDCASAESASDSEHEQ